MTVSDYISVTALLISALALFLSWRQYLRDQSHLKIEVSVQKDAIKGPFYRVQAVNKGRRPLTIIAAYARVSSGKMYPVFDSRTVLNETDTLSFDVPFYDFFKTLSSRYYIVAFEVEDSTGRHYVVKTNRLRRQVANILRQQQQMLEQYRQESVTR